MTHSLIPLDMSMCSSAQRGEAVIDWVLANILTANEDMEFEAALGAQFWKVVVSEWSGFDRINHDFYQIMFNRFRKYWPDIGKNQVSSESFEVWRGQNQSHQQVGLSWTTDVKVAAGFGRGFRYTNPEPVLFQATVDICDVAFFQDDREEAEVVLFQAPKSYKTVATGKDEIAKFT